MSRQIVSLVAILLGAVSFSASAEKFPSYLNESYCSDLKKEFMTSVMPSLKSYSEHRFNRDKRASLRNTKEFLDKRVDWMKECNDYLSKTEGDYIFRDAQTTKHIFASLEDVSREMGFALDGVLFFDDVDPVTREFDNLFQLTDAHETKLMLNGELAAY